MNDQNIHVRNSKSHLGSLPIIPLADLVPAGLVTLSHDEKIDIEGEISGTPISMRLHFKDVALPLVVLLNGAVNREQSKGKVFQRSSWSGLISANVLNIEDPMLIAHESINIGWAQGDFDKPYMPNMHRAILMVSSAISGNFSASRLYFGSSAGGYQALCLGALDPGSVVVVNNPQIDWTKYYEKEVSSVMEVSYPGISLHELRSFHPERCNAIELMKHEKNFPMIDYWINTSSKADVVKQLGSLTSSLTEVAEGLLTSGLRVNFYANDKQGHLPMDKSMTLRAINNHLSENC